MKQIITKALEHNQNIMLNHKSLPNIKVKDINQHIPDDYDLIVINPTKEFIISILPHDNIIELNGEYELINDHTYRNPTTRKIYNLSLLEPNVIRFTNEPNNTNFAKAIEWFRSGKIVKFDDKLITRIDFSGKFSWKLGGLFSLNEEISGSNTRRIVLINEYRHDYELLTLFKNNMDTHSFILSSPDRFGKLDVIDVMPSIEDENYHRIKMINKETLKIESIRQDELFNFKLESMCLK